jgi:hypothetical protein
VPAQRTAKYVLQLLLRAPELFIGNDTPFLLQLLGGPGEKGALDVVCTLLAPEGDVEGTKLCCTLRGPVVLAFVASFMEEFPEAPVLVERAPQTYDYVLCEVDDESWTRGPITLQRLRMLRALNGREQLHFFLPAEVDKPSQAVAIPRLQPRPQVYLD